MNKVLTIRYLTTSLVLNNWTQVITHKFITEPFGFYLSFEWFTHIYNVHINKMNNKNEIKNEIQKTES